MTTGNANGAHGWRAVLRRQTARTARWLHIYLSMVSFAIVLFFSVTGLTLNHPNWFSNAVSTREGHGTLGRPLPSLGTGDKPDISKLIAALHSREHLHGAIAPEDIRIDEGSISFSFRAPGYSADVSVDRSTGDYTVTEVRNGFVAVLNDLHKGRDAGRVWGWLIDISAVLLTLVSLTGLVILWFVYKRRTSGLLLGAFAGLSCFVIYKIFVP